MHRLYFLRHGETSINVEGGRFQGQIDTPEAGLTEAERSSMKKGVSVTTYKLMADYGFSQVKVERDFAGHDRYASGVLA